MLASYIGFVIDHYKIINITPLKTNISPEKWWLEDVFLFEIVPFFRGHVSFPGGFKYCLCSPLVRKDLNPFWLAHIFQMGWQLNHQPDKDLGGVSVDLQVLTFKRLGFRRGDAAPSAPSGIPGRQVGTGGAPHGPKASRNLAQGSYDFGRERKNIGSNIV